MNVGDERSRSCWMDEGPAADAPPLDGDATCDVVVIGSGIAGLSTAYELACFGRQVIVIDRGRIGWGMTARTTAHLATELDDFYSQLISVRGEDEARLYYDSQVAAVNRIEGIVRNEGIGCDFARIDGYLFAAEESHNADLEEEYQACRTLGMDVEWADRAPVPGCETGMALRFPNQARFHPLKYLSGLVRAIEARGGRLYGDTAYVSEDEDDHGVTIHTEASRTIRASAAVFATNSPVNDKLVIHTKQLPGRTYAIAGRVPKGSVPDALVWDSQEAYHYVRIQPLTDAEDLIIVGGEDHKTGEVNDQEQRLDALETWTRERYPTFTRADYRWSGQVMEPIDFMPFSGRNPGSRHIYVHTGDSGQGITNGVAGALTLLPLIIGEDSRWAALLDPSRKSVSVGSAMEFVRGQAGVAKNFSEYVQRGDVSSAEQIRAGEGAIINEGMKKLACYRAEDGTLVRRSAACTHTGCLIHWNGFEKCWDCPCHGSHFSPEGEVLNGPAVQPLAAVED
jgi:glycine/D-amino acid oxidase-like deaminating enzyme/nitrite reductase/ring-hydroxylating ferredoxin subunit